MTRSWCLPLMVGGFLAVAASCGSGDEPPEDSNGGSAANGGGANTGNGGGANVGNATGTGAMSFIDTGTGTGGGDLPDACVGADQPAKLTTVNLIFMFDKSGSMGNPDNFPPERAAERWNPVSQGMLAFFQDPGTTQLNASLEFFPVDGSLQTACDVAQYETPLVPLTSLDEAAGSAPFIAALERTTPLGGTPTLPALQGAINYAIEVALADSAAKTVVVLVTDGEPGFWIDPPGETQPGCEGNDIDHTAAVARAAFEGTPRILTYVIGIGPSLEALDTIANNGGTGFAIMVPVGNPDDTKTTFQRELARIRTLHLDCNVAIPEPPENEALDPGMVNVKYITAGGEQIIGRAEECPDDVGWDYTEFDDAGLPTVIELCQNSCAAVQGDESGQIQVQFGCATVVP